MTTPTKTNDQGHWVRKNPEKQIEKLRKWITKEEDLMKLESAARTLHRYLRSVRHEKEFEKV